MMGAVVGRQQITLEVVEVVQAVLAETLVAQELLVMGVLDLLIA